MVGGKKNGSMVDAIAGVDRRNKVAAKAKGAVNWVKNAGKQLSNRVSSSGKGIVKTMRGHAGRVANKVRGMKKKIMRGKNVGKKIGKGLRKLSKVAKMGTLFGKIGLMAGELDWGSHE